MNLEKQLLDLKGKIESLTKKRDQAVWERDNVKKEMKEQYKLSSVEEAEKVIRKIEAEAEDLERQTKESIEQITQEHETMLELA